MLCIHYTCYTSKSYVERSVCVFVDMVHGVPVLLFVYAIDDKDDDPEVSVRQAVNDNVCLGRTHDTRVEHVGLVQISFQIR